MLLCNNVISLTASLLLPLEKIFFSRVGLVMFKCSNNMLPNVISNLYIKNNEIHSHFTRNSNLLRIPKGTPNFTTISARVWNEIVTKILMDQHVSISKFFVRVVHFKKITYLAFRK